MKDLTFVSRTESNKTKKIFQRSYPLSHLVFQLSASKKYWSNIFETKTCLSEILIMENQKNQKTDTYFDVKKYHQLLDELKENLKEENYFERISQRIENILEETRNLSKNKNILINNINKENILDIFKDYWDKSYKVTTAFWAFDIVGDALVERLIEKLNEDKENSPEVIQNILFKNIPSIFSKEKIAFLETTRKIKKTNDKSFLLEHLKEWAFMGMENPIAKSFSIEDLEKRYNHWDDEDLDLEIKRIESITLGEIEELDKLMSKDNISEETKTTITQVRKFMSYKNNERLSLQKDISSGLDIFYKIFEYCNLPIHEFGYIFENEIISIIKGDIKIEDLKRNITKRKNKIHRVYLKNGYNTVEEIQDEKKKIIDKLIKGSIASQGIARGVVKIISDPSKDFAKLNQGDILVTSMTTPDFVPLMERAGAIVTNEGGALCHAAIVSREMGVPAIVGTDNATEILKDGMIVEVLANGDEGIINIIKNWNENEI